MAKQAQAAGQGQAASPSGKAAAKKRVVKVEAVGQAHLNATFNNLIISLTNNAGQVISWSSAGKMGKVAHDLGLRKVKVFVKGPGAGRESAIRTLASIGIEVSEIMDITPIPHNGCRAPKRRRV
jgi:small subunit ribosomal protein S11